MKWNKIIIWKKNKKKWKFKNYLSQNLKQYNNKESVKIQKKKLLI